MLWLAINILGVVGFICFVVAMLRHALGYDVTKLLYGGIVLTVLVIWAILYKLAGVAWYWVLKHPDAIRVKDWFSIQGVGGIRLAEWLLIILLLGTPILGACLSIVRPWIIEKRTRCTRGIHLTPCPRCGGTKYQFKRITWIRDSCTPLGSWRGIVECPCGNYLDHYLPFFEFPIDSDFSDIKHALVDAFCTQNASNGDAVVNNIKGEESCLTRNGKN